MKYLARITFILVCISITMCRQKQTETSQEFMPSELKISLAQWSIHRSINDGKLKAENFAAIAKNEFGISAIEYVNQFYVDYATDSTFWLMMRSKADSLEVKSLLIMVDNEGDLGNPNADERDTAVKNHFKWVDAASILGCHSIRVNAFGDGSSEEVKQAMIDALKQLGAYAASKSINVIIENHGLFSSDGKWITDIMKSVNMSNVGTLPDFGNWCTKEKWGSTEGGKCPDAYDRYLGVTEFLPFAKGVSAKSYSFDESGNEEVIDYTKMLKVVKDSGFDGYIGIEYEGSGLSEFDGIRATKKLLEKAYSAM